MRTRQLLTCLLVILVAACVAPQAGLADLPLGRPGLAETRHVQRPAPGVTETEIVRGQPSADQFFVVDLGFTLDRASADALAGRLRDEGIDGSVLPVDGGAPDAPNGAYLVRVGHYASAADAQPTANRLTAEGHPGVHVDYTGDDGTATGGPWRVHVLDVDPHRFRGTVQPALATGVVPGRETVSSLAARTGAFAGINGGYFVIGAADGTPGDLAGISVIGGELVSEAVNGRTSLLMPSPDGAGAVVAPLSTALRLRAADGARREIDGRNRRPGLIRACGGDPTDVPTALPLHDITCTDPSELIQFTPAFGATTDPASEVEAVLDGAGRVTSLRWAGGPIPPDCSVLAGTGDGADWLRAHARPGERLRVTVRLRSGGRRVPLRRRLGVVNGGPRLLDHGRTAIDAAAEGFTHPGDPEFFYRFGVRRNPRTLAGVTRAGHLLLVAVDGRAPGYSDGLSFAEEAAVTRALGAGDALNLDGGGSTAMTVGSTLLTRPSDATGERPVGDAIVLRR